MPNADATGLATLLLLALGTFVAGVHTLLWQTGTLGVVMALAVPPSRGLGSALILILRRSPSSCLAAFSGGSAAAYCRRPGRGRLKSEQTDAYGVRHEGRSIKSGLTAGFAAAP